MKLRRNDKTQRPASTTRIPKRDLAETDLDQIAGGGSRGNVVTFV